MSKEKFNWNKIKIGIVSGFVGVLVLYILILLIAGFGVKLLLHEKSLQFVLKLLIMLSAGVCAARAIKISQFEAIIQILTGETILLLAVLLPALNMHEQIKLVEIAADLIIIIVGGYLGIFLKSKTNRKKFKRKRKYRK